MKTDAQPPLSPRGGGGGGGAIAVFLVLVILVSLSGTLLLMARPKPITITIHPPIPSATTVLTATPDFILVYVSGAVQRPEESYRLPLGSRVGDAVEAAGGFTELADRTRVNPAAILRDGDQAHVFPIKVTVATKLPTPQGGPRVYLNSASIEELETLPGIGPAMARRIIEFREQVSPIDNFEDLDKVAGVGPALLEGLKDLVSFD